MCLAKAYLDREEEAQVIMENIVTLRVQEDTLRLYTIYGEEKVLKGLVREIDFEGSKIIIESRT